MILQRTILLLMILTVLPQTIVAQGQPLDFDQDGLSDLVIVQIGSDNSRSLSWNKLSSIDSNIHDLGRLGRAGDHIILRDWLNQGSPQIGVVSLNSQNNAISWKIRDTAQNTHTKIFGTGGQTVVSGGDFNNNGYGDAAIVYQRSRHLMWQIKYDIFSNESTEPQQVRFGKKGDQPFFASVNGNGDWLAVGRYIKANIGRLLFRHPVTGQTATVTVRGRMAGQLNKTIPHRLKQANGTDLVVLTQKLGGRTAFFFKKLDNSAAKRFVFSGNGDVAVGNFTDAPGQEIVLQQSNQQYLVFNPENKEKESWAGPEGILVDESNINRFKAVNTPSQPINPPIDTPNTPPNNPNNGSCGQIPSSFIYKTIGSSHFNDVRRNTIGLILRKGAPGPYPSCVEVKDTRGNLIAKMGGYYPAGDEWAARYYAGIGCGSSTPLNGAAIAKKAKSNTGSSLVIFDFGSKCYGPVDANRCIGSSQC